MARSDGWQIAVEPVTLPPMTRATPLRTALFVTPPALLLLAAALGLWAKFGLGIYFDAITGALAGCF